MSKTLRFDTPNFSYDSCRPRMGPSLREDAIAALYPGRCADCIRTIYTGDDQTDQEGKGRGRYLRHRITR
jgi:hypothetical protein